MKADGRRRRRKRSLPCLAGLLLSVTPIDATWGTFESVAGASDWLPEERRRYLLAGWAEQQRRGRARIDTEFFPEADPLTVSSIRNEDDLDLIREETMGIVDSGSNDCERNEDSVTHLLPLLRRKLHLALSCPPDSANNNSDAPWSLPKSKLRSTGTTIVGCLVENGKYVVLGADTRATDDRMVADKKCEKIHRLATNVWCCGAGTSGDLDALTRYTQYSFALDALAEDTIGNASTDRDADVLSSSRYDEGGIILRPVSVSAVIRFLRNALYDGNGSLGANLIVGGYDNVEQCGRLAAIHPHGSMDVVPYAALGSGGLAAMSVLEARYRPDMTLDRGIALVKDAVSAGIDNDLGSGSQVDLCVLGPDGMVEYTRALVAEEQLEEMEKDVLDEMRNALHRDEQDEQEATGGVNGFGNLPFSVQSRRVAATVGRDAKRDEEWDNFLGFSIS